MDDGIQQQRLNGGLTKPMGSTEGVGGDSEGPRKYGSNSVVLGRNVEGGGTVSVTLWKQ